MSFQGAIASGHALTKLGELYESTYRDPKISRQMKFSEKASARYCLKEDQDIEDEGSERSEDIEHEGSEYEDYGDNFGGLWWSDDEGGVYGGSEYEDYEYGGIEYEDSDYEGSDNEGSEGEGSDAEDMGD